MRKLLWSLLLIIVFFIFSKHISAQDKTIYFFYGTGCPHCAKVETYFEEKGFFNKYKIEKKEIYFDHAGTLFYMNLMDEKQVPEDSRGVPTVVIGDTVLIGDEPIIENFEENANSYLRGITNPIIRPTAKKVNHKMDLTIFAIIAGAVVDAINPCEFAVLIILMTTIMATGKAKKALASGFAFSASIFISYFLMGLGLYSALGVGGVSHIFYRLIGWVAVLLGILNLKDYFWYGKGVLMEVPLSWRPKLKSLIHSVTSPAGAFAIGFLVSLFLLPCTSGPYIVILGMLAKKGMFTQSVAYLLLYNLIFISPMLLISLAVYKGFNPEKAEEIRQKQLRMLHLIAGLLMVAMGVVILLGWI